MLLDFNILDYYKSSAALVRDHGLSILDIEGMFPFEYEIYINEALNYLEERKKNAKKH